LAHLSDWLGETGELYVDVYMPHSGGSGIEYIFLALSDMKNVVVNHNWPELIFTAFRKQFFPLRGRVNSDLIAQAQQMISNGQYYEILDPSKLFNVEKPFPGLGVTLADGNSHDELLAQLENLTGQDVAVGTHPFDYHDTDYYFARPEEAFVLKVARDHSVSKNWQEYEPFNEQPEKYAGVIHLWTE